MAEDGSQSAYIEIFIPFSDRNRDVLLMLEGWRACIGRKGGN